MSIKDTIVGLLYGHTAVGQSNQKTRDEWVREALRTIPHGATILDAGAGELRYKPYCDHLNYTAQDFGQYNGTGDSLGLQTGSWDQSKLDIVSDIIAIPVPDNSFDAILCTEVFEHIPDPALAIKEFARILKPGGTLIVTAPFCSLTHFAPFHFSTGFNRYYYEHHLDRNGFTITEMSPNGNFYEYLAQEIRRIPEVIRIYQKRQPNAFTKFVTLLYGALLLRQLEKLALSENTSNQLLCHGYHVVAKKN